MTPEDILLSVLAAVLLLLGLLTLVLWLLGTERLYP